MKNAAVLINDAKGVTAVFTQDFDKMIKNVLIKVYFITCRKRFRNKVLLHIFIINEKDKLLVLCFLFLFFLFDSHFNFIDFLGIGVSDFDMHILEIKAVTFDRDLIEHIDDPGG